MKQILTRIFSTHQQVGRGSWSGCITAPGAGTNDHTTSLFLHPHIYVTSQRSLARYTEAHANYGPAAHKTSLGRTFNCLPKAV